jgi:hypothetical protein
MMDFAACGEVVSRSRGYSPGRFVVALERSIALAADEVVHAESVALAVRNLALEEEWHDTTARLFHRLPRHAEPHDRRDWPSSEDALGKRLRVVAPALARIGVEMRFDKGLPPKRERLVHIRWTGTATAGSRRPCVQRVPCVHEPESADDRAGREAQIAPAAAWMDGRPLLLPPRTASGEK